jgi:NAD(P)-dependent dehydrogenase (short-subunit alcohol dehydrogenase family)
MDLSLGLAGAHVVVTGAAGHIGTAVVIAFLAAGCRVSAFDIREPEVASQDESVQWHLVDITDEAAVDTAWIAACGQWGPVSACVAVAGVDLSYLPHHSSICDMELGQWQRTNKVNGDGTFLTARAWLRGVKAQADKGLRNVSLIIIGSEAGVFGVTGNADYSASKAAIQYGLVKSLMKDAVAIHSRARVNAIAPGAVHTKQFDKECAEDPSMLWLESQATVAMKAPVPVDQVAKCCLFLASESWSGSITGQVVQVDGGKSGRLFWGQDENSV